MLAVVFHCFFNLRGCTFKDSVSPVLVFQKTSFKCFRNQGILVIEFTISQTILYFAGIFMLNGKQLLNKTNTNVSPKMFVYSQDDKSFYKCLNEDDGTFTKIYDDGTRLE